MAEVHHETVFFTGRVQGVGFRYSTLQVAKEFEITGFVKNLPDGRVHLEAQGAKGEVDAFVKSVEEADARLHPENRAIRSEKHDSIPGFSDSVRPLMSFMICLSGGCAANAEFHLLG
ncbi:MAG: acylphosphatase [Nibricoccus sp.]